VLGWSKDEYQIFLMGMRKVLRNTKNIHIYCKYKYVYGRKPGGPVAAWRQPRTALVWVLIYLPFLELTRFVVLATSKYQIERTVALP
jgi:hypothetical protein